MNSNELTRLYQALRQKQRSGVKLTKKQKDVFTDMACKTALLMQKAADQEQILKQMINKIAAADPELANVLRNTLTELQHETETLDEVRQEFRNIVKD